MLAQYTTCVTVHGLELASRAQVKSSLAQEDLYKSIPITREHGFVDPEDRFAEGFWKETLLVGE